MAHPDSNSQAAKRTPSNWLKRNGGSFVGDSAREFLRSSADTNEGL